MIRLREQEFKDIVSYMRDHYGINLEKKKVLIECRLTKELERLGLTSFDKYLLLLHRDADGMIAKEMVNRLTTNYTYFMREPAHFTLLEDTIFPELFERRRFSSCNIWCAGCATGEECYTLAMSIQSYREQGRQTPGIRILATDISEEVLSRARTGVFPIKELSEIPENWQKSYCRILNERTFAIEEQLRSRIRFECRNLMEPDGGQEKYDLILCRNVMIYFDRKSKEKLVRSLEKRLNPGGYLLIGHAELLSREETELESCYPAAYRKKI